MAEIVTLKTQTDTFISTAVNKCSSTFAWLRLKWLMLDTLWEGTEAMREAGQLYLPKEEVEQEIDYQSKLNRACLTPSYKQAVKKAVSRVFAHDIALVDDPPTLTNFCLDVDGQGNDLSQFFKNVFEDAFHGCSYILVDYQRRVDGVDLNDTSRPYLVHIKASQVLDVRSKLFNGVQRLSSFRYEEKISQLKEDGFTEVHYNQVRVFKQDPGTPVTFTVYRQQENSTVWSLVDEGIIIGVDSIPIVPNYTDRIDFYVGTPPLLDLGYLNVHHFQRSADYVHSLHIVTTPLLLLAGVLPERQEGENPGVISQSINSALVTPNVSAKGEYIEHSGQALGSAADYLKELEAKMEALGMQLMLPQNSGNITATSHAISAAESNSQLKSYALSLQDAIDACFFYTLQYLGESPDKGRSLVNTQYAVEFAPDNSFNDVLAMETQGIIDKQVVILEAQRRNILDTDAEIEMAGETSADEEAAWTEKIVNGRASIIEYLMSTRWVKEKDGTLRNLTREEAVAKLAEIDADNLLAPAKASPVINVTNNASLQPEEEVVSPEEEENA